MFIDFLIILRDTASILNVIFGVVVVVSEQKNPASTWAWLMVVLILPYFGFIIYLVFGLDGRRVLNFTHKARRDQAIQKEYDRTIAEPVKNKLQHLKHVTSQNAHSQNNRIKFFFEGDKKMDSLFADIKNAKKHIHVQYYIFRNDALGKKFIDILSRKAEEGVEVRLLLDGMGCLWNSKKLYRPLIKAGGYVGIFLPPQFVRINFRNHRKLVIIDGNLAYTGGFNIGVEYLGKGKKYPYWRDCHMRIEGRAARDLQLRFIMDWNFCVKNKLGISDKYFPDIEPVGVTCMQIVCSGPDTKWKSIQYTYNKMISLTENYIYITTPYFVPDDSILESLRIAALSGVDVRIMIPANPDHPFVYWAALSYIGELLEAGVKCYQFGKGFMHSKLMIVDDKIASVGTANMDVRSFKLNFEVNGFIYDSKCATELKKQFIQDLNECSEIDLKWYRSCSKLTRIKESISRLLSPLL